jgi:cullin 3
LYIKVDKIIGANFENNKLFTDARDQAFGEVLNSFGGTPKYLAAYCDDKLKGKLHKMETDDANSLVNYLIKLFCLLNERDTFMKAYKYYLSIRLLGKSYSSQEYE